MTTSTEESSERQFSPSFCGAGLSQVRNRVLIQMFDGFKDEMFKEVTFNWQSPKLLHSDHTPSIAIFLTLKSGLL